MARRLGGLILLAAMAALTATTVTAQSRSSGALGGMGEALQRLGEDMQRREAQRELLQEQHRLEMQRIERLHELQREENERQRQRQIQQQPPVPVAAPPPTVGYDLAAEQRKVTQAHPDWVTLRNTADFHGWMQAQPASVQRLKESNRAEDVILIFDLYKRDRPSR